MPSYRWQLQSVSGEAQFHIMTCPYHAIIMQATVLVVTHTRHPRTTLRHRAHMAWVVASPQLHWEHWAGQSWVSDPALCSSNLCRAGLYWWLTCSTSLLVSLSGAKLVPLQKVSLYRRAILPEE